jgi:hypothetical protein
VAERNAGIFSVESGDGLASPLALKSSKEQMPCGDCLMFDAKILAKVKEWAWEVAVSLMTDNAFLLGVSAGKSSRVLRRPAVQLPSGPFQPCQAFDLLRWNSSRSKSHFVFNSHWTVETLERRPSHNAWTLSGNSFS